MANEKVNLDVKISNAMGVLCYKDPIPNFQVQQVIRKLFEEHEIVLIEKDKEIAELQAKLEAAELEIEFRDWLGFIGLTWNGKSTMAWKINRVSNTIISYEIPELRQEFLNKILIK